MSVLCWLNFTEDRNRCLNLKMDFFFLIAVGEMWILGQERNPIVGFWDFAFGAGHTCCLGWEL